jgi:L,D-transpeptidase ErfK/SrfK
MRLWIIIGIVVVACIGTGVWLAIALSKEPAFVWVDPAPPDNSLALEAQRKLSGPGPTEPVDKSSSSRSKRSKQDNKQAVRLPPKGPYIVIDTHANRIYWRTVDSVLFSALCSTGTGGELVDTVGGREWRFHTPRGIFAADSRLTDPWWRKPDWAFLEEGEPIPKSERDRLDGEVMGEYAIGFGDGFFIHGTLYERLIGVAATHGCVRMSAPDLEYLYPKVKMGTPVVIF